MTLLTNAMVRMGVVVVRRKRGEPSPPPLTGYDAERFAEGDARLFLSIEARDHAIGALVHDMRIYTAGEVLYGMHYAEAVTFDVPLRNKRRLGIETRGLLEASRAFSR